MKSGRLKPVVSTLSQETEARLQKNAFLTDLRVDGADEAPPTTSRLRQPITVGGKLVGVIYLEGADTANPRVLEHVIRCSNILAKTLGEWVSREKDEQEAPEGPCGGARRVCSGIPSGHPEKQAIEDACEQALRDLPGSWTIDILPDQRLSGWIVGITGPTFYDWLLVSSAQQNGPFIQAFIHDVLRKRGLRT